VNKKTQKPGSGNFFRIIIGAATIAAPAALAQQQDLETNIEGEIYTLSPFVLNSEDDTRYLATSTLAGSRLNMNLSDVGSAVSVVTKEFMDDTGATDVSTLLPYALNTESATGEQANFSAALEVGNGRFSQNNARLNPQGAQRVRGLAEATLTRDYFLTNIPFDSYNTDTVTINRGPNSLLFGVGSPGGVINGGLTQAVLGEDFTEVSARLGERSSHRFSLDLNRSIVKDRLSIRAALLESDTQFKQRPAYQKESRQYVAVNAVLLKNESIGWLGETSLRANFENGTIDSVPPNNIPVFDGISLWFGLPDNLDEVFEITGGTPPAFTQNYTPKWTVDNSTGQAGNIVELYGPSFGSIFDQLNVYYNDPNSPVSSVGLADASVDGVVSSTWWPGVQGAPAGWGFGRPEFSQGFFNDRWAPGFSFPNIIDTNIYDNRRTLLTGNLQFVDQEFDATNIKLEQTFINNMAGFEIAYNEENYLRNGHMPGSVADSFNVAIDLREKLNNGHVNPNLGRPFIHDRGIDNDRVETSTDREVLQATAYYRLDFRDFDQNWTRWLGRHTFTGFLSQQTIDVTERANRISMVGPEIPSIFGSAGVHQWPRNIPVVAYLGPSVLGPEFQSASDVRLQATSARIPQPGEVYTVQYPPSVWKGDEFINDRFLQADFTVEEFLVEAARSRRELDSKVFSVQSDWFNNSIVTVVGWRSDKIVDIQRVQAGVYDALANTSNYRFQNGAIDPGSLILSDLPEDRESVSGDTFTASVVAHVPESWLKLPMSTRLSFHFNESENFSASAVRRDIYGQVLPPPTGDTKEYGFAVTTLNNKLFMRFNWFETNSSNAAGPLVQQPREISFSLTDWKQVELSGISFADIMQINADVTGADVSSQFGNYQDVYDALLAVLPQPVQDRFLGFDDGGTAIWEPNPGQSTTQAFVAEGFEFELSGLLADNWSVTMNVANQDTIRSGIAPVGSDFVFTVLDNLTNNPTGQLMSRPQTQEDNLMLERWRTTTVNPLLADLANEGRLSRELRKWRVNLVTNYEFTQGLLKDFQIGGAIRWQDKVSTGYEVEVTPDGRVFPNLDRPFFGDAETNVDLWIKYGRPIMNGKVDWQIQLNVRNLYRSNDDFIPVLTNPDGQDVIFRNPPPREVFVTNTFRF